MDGLGPALAAAKKAGIVVINVNQRVSDPKVTDAYVGANPVEGGEIEMGYIAKEIGGKGNVAFLLGPLGSDAEIGRTQGYENVLKNYPDIKVAYKQTANWRTDEALKLAENWLQTGADLAAIVSNNDDMALGAVKAIKDAHLVGKIKVAGIDAAPNALAAVKDGSMSRHRIPEHHRPGEDGYGGRSQAGERRKDRFDDHCAARAHHEGERRQVHQVASSTALEFRELAGDVRPTFAKQSISGALVRGLIRRLGHPEHRIGSSLRRA